MRLVENRVLERGEHLSVVSDAQEHRASRALLELAALLQERDRILVELALRRVSHRQIAEAMKLPPGTVTRRLHRLSRRLHDPVVLALLDPRCPLEPQIRQLGVERFLSGLTQEQLAAKHGLTEQEVKKRLGFVTGWHRGLHESASLNQRARAGGGSGAGAGSGLSGRKVTRNQVRPSGCESGA